MHATLKGHFRWQALDERGVPEVPRNPGGFALANADGVRQANLITDLGMDAIAEHDVIGTAVSSTFFGTPWRDHLKAGTGSTAPAVTDTALDNEVQRDDVSGAFSSGANVISLLSSPDVLRIESTITRILTMTADRNLTEIGFCALDTTEAYIRELLRDELNNPVTVSLLTNKILRVDHTLTADIALPVAGTAATINIDKYDATNALESSTPYDVVYGLIGFDGSSSSLTAMANLWRPNSRNVTTTNIFGVRAVDVPVTYARTGVIDSTKVEPPTEIYATMSLASYVPGSYERIKRATVEPGDGNFPWYGFQFGAGLSESTGNTTRYSGFLLVFDNPATYTKVDTDSVRVGTVSTWARA